MGYHDKLPRRILRLFQLICPRGLQEEIEGDLLEKFEKDLHIAGIAAARRNFNKEVWHLTRFSFAYRLNKNFMNTRKWIGLIGAVLLVVLASLVPFLPGPYSLHSIGLSALAQMMGFFGLVGLPIGVFWLLLELYNRRYPHKKINSWTNGFYLSLLIAVPALGFLLLLLSFAIYEVGWLNNIPSVAFVILLIVYFFPRIKRLKTKTAYRFNPAPLYLIILPLVALYSRVQLIEPLANVSRERAIVQSRPIINALEKYRMEKGTYPLSLNELQGDYLDKIPESTIMGIRQYEYEKSGSAYQLYFVQWLHWGATREVVIYDKSKLEANKGYFAMFNTGHSDWKYYWFD